jgi:assimilatory nitrate reductase electron transfer subunit
MLMEQERIVVVGNGMAGSRFVSEVRQRDPDVPVSIFGAEAEHPYNRVLLSNVLAGSREPHSIGMVDGSWYQEHNVDARFNTTVTFVDREAGVVHASDNTRTRYKTLVLATGSQAVIPSMPGTENGLPDGATAFRTLGDCRTIMDSADSARNAVVIGGGLLGIEAARGLAGRGIDTTVIHAKGHLMDRQLDCGAGRVLTRTLNDLGVRFRFGQKTTALHSENNKVTGVEVNRQEVLPASLVIFACGVRPEVGLARAAGLAVDKGVVVDGELRSVCDPNVRAIGECSQHEGEVYGLVSPAWEQASVLADLLTKPGSTARFAGSQLVTRLKAQNVELVAMGNVQHDPDSEDVEVVQFADPTRKTYKKIVVRDDRLIGAVLLGETDTAGILSQFYERSAEVPADRLGLLFPNVSGRTVSETPVRIPDHATICNCNNVSKGDIHKSWELGARTVEAVACKTRATTGCGGCTDAVDGIVSWLNKQEATF